MSTEKLSDTPEVDAAWADGTLCWEKARQLERRLAALRIENEGVKFLLGQTENSVMRRSIDAAEIELEDAGRPEGEWLATGIKALRAELAAARIALGEIDHEVRDNDLSLDDDPSADLIEAHRICDRVAGIIDACSVSTRAPGPALGRQDTVQADESPAGENSQLAAANTAQRKAEDVCLNFGLQVAALEARCKAAEQDAVRYRWWRYNRLIDTDEACDEINALDDSSGTSLDASIDAALAKAQAGGEGK